MAKAKKEVAVEEEDKAVLIKPDLEKYTAGISASGKRTQHCGDHVAETLNGMSVEECEVIAGRIVPEYVDGKYSHLNVGMQRMNIANRLRGAVAAMEKEEEGAGVAKFDKAAAAGVKARDKRTAEAEKAKAEAAKEKKEKAAEKAKAEAAKEKAAAKKAA